MSKQDVYIVSAARTAIGNFNGAIASVPTPKLGSIAVQEAVQRAGIDGSLIEEAHMGCVLIGALGQAPARQAVLGAGLPQSIPCVTLHKVCGSGLETVITTGRAICLGEIDVAIAGGMENMSAAAFALPKARSGYKMGHGQFLDLMIHDGLWDPYNDIHMGTIAERCVAKTGLSRDEQDDFAVSSYTRSNKAIEEGSNKWEIVPVEIPQRKGDAVIFAEDESPKLFNEAKLRKLKPAFDKNGTITAGNASSINDGAAALILASEQAIKKHNLKPLARIVSWGHGALAPDEFPIAPEIAVKSALKTAKLEAKDISYWEINEAFAAVAVLAMKEFDLNPDIVNILGGAISMGHPIGCSGARILTTLLNVLNIKQGKYGLATLCIGGGEANALIIERV